MIIQIILNHFIEFKELLTKNQPISRIGTIYLYQ